ncbi:heavy metal transporter [Streptomyces sp. TR02-1]
MSEKVESSAPSGRSRGKRGRLLRGIAACLVLAGVAGYVVTQYVISGSGPARCTVLPSGGSGGSAYRIHPEQAANAATIAAVASSRGLPDRAVTIALATAMQESGLRNIEHGDRDSLGLFQQRPSQGWGEKRQIMDPVYSAGKFYEHLVEVPGYSRLPLTVAAQEVQRSGFPQAYAKHEVNATLLTAALTGRRAAALNCTVGPGAGSSAPGDPEQVRERLAREFGPGVLGAGGKHEGAVAGKNGGSGGARGAESVFAAPTGPGASRGAGLVLPADTPERGWELAHWAVAQAGELRIAVIAYDGRVWSAERSEEGWRPAEAGTDEARRPGAVVLNVGPGD